MIEGDRVLAVIAARGGSKGLPGKNVRPLGGKPLIAWSIEAAAASRVIDRAIVSTDDAHIARIARQWNGEVPFMRPAELATDEASIVDCVLHAAKEIDCDYRYVVLLQATSPLRRSTDIDAALKRCHETGAPACVGVTPFSKAAWLHGVDDAGHLSPLLGHDGPESRRQDLPAAYMPNGAVFVAELGWLKRTRQFYGPDTVAHVMPPERSIDIDTLLDFRLAELLVGRSKATAVA